MKKLKKYITKLELNEFSAKLSYSQMDKSVIEKSGFATHQDAMNWLDEELEKIQPSYERMSFKNLADVVEKNPNNVKAREVLKYKIDNLKDQILFTLVAKEGINENQARSQVNKSCGKKWIESFNKAKDNTLDALESLELEKTQERLKSLLNYHKDGQWNASEEAKEVLRLIKKIPGKKIITTILGMKDQAFDIDSNGKVGYDTGHENMLLKVIDSAFNQENIFTIRQFIPNSEEDIILKNGKKVKIPWKALYSFAIVDNGILSIDAEDVEHGFTHDQNDNPIEKEEMVIFKDFSEIFEIG